MRTDMNKVIGDVYRHGSGIITKAGRPPRELDAMPARESMRSPYKGGWGSGMKSSSCNVSPVRRFLDKQVGRPWNTVYSEICRTYDARKPTNRQIYQLVDQLVTRQHLVVIDGKVMEALPYSTPSEPTGLYVHPVTGLLVRASLPTYRAQWNADAKEAAARKKEELARRERVISDTMKLVKLNDLWFVIEMAPVTAPRKMMVYRRTDLQGNVHEVWDVVPESICVDVLTGIGFGEDYISCHPHITMYAKSKRQASHKELKQYGVL